MRSSDDATRQQFQAGVKAYDEGDYAKAFASWLPLAESGDLGALRNVAHLLRQGLGVEKDPERAIGFYREAAENGLISAQVNLGIMFLNGEGIRPSPERAARWFYRAAKSGHPQAQFVLAGLLESGTGLKANPQAAAAYYLASARSGYTPALAVLSEQGIEVKKTNADAENGDGGRAAPILKLPEKDISLLYGGTFAD